MLVSQDEVLWVCGALQSLSDLGLVEGGIYRVPPKGMAKFDQIDMDLNISDESLTHIVTCGGLPCRDGILDLLKLFRDHRESIYEYLEKNNGHL